MEKKPAAFLEIFAEKEVGPLLPRGVDDAPQGHVVASVVHLRIPHLYLRLHEGPQQGPDFLPRQSEPVGEDEIRSDEVVQQVEPQMGLFAPDALLRAVGETKDLVIAVITKVILVIIIIIQIIQIKRMQVL